MRKGKRAGDGGRPKKILKKGLTNFSLRRILMPVRTATVSQKALWHRFFFMVFSGRSGPLYPAGIRRAGRFWRNAISSIW